MSNLTMIFLVVIAFVGLFFFLKLMYKLFVLELELIIKYWPVLLVIIIALILLAVFGDIIKGIFQGIFH